MVKRPPILDPDSLSPAQARVAEAIVSGPRGRLDGPLAVWLNSAELADRAQQLGAFCRYGTTLEPHVSELLILVMGAYWGAGLEWAIHAPIAREAGIAPSIIDALAAHEQPEFTCPMQLAAFDFASELLAHKRVVDTTYANAIAQFGQRGVVELVGILGYYSLISMTINAFEIPVPEGGENPFAAPSRD